MNFIAKFGSKAEICWKLEDLFSTIYFDEIIIFELSKDQTFRIRCTLMNPEQILILVTHLTLLVEDSTTKITAQNYRFSLWKLAPKIKIAENWKSKNGISWITPKFKVICWDIYYFSERLQWITTLKKYLCRFSKYGRCRGRMTHHRRVETTNFISEESYYKGFPNKEFFLQGISEQGISQTFKKSKLHIKK